MVHLAIAAAVTTAVWIKEYSAQRGAELPVYHWWFSDLTRFGNSFATSFVDYLFGGVGFAFFLAEESDLMVAVSEVLVIPTGVKKAIDAILPLDAWRYFQWDNRLANWFGHFAFTILLMWLASTILRWRRLKWLRFGLAAALLLPLVGIFVGQHIALP
jgi:hypothetical protein